MTVQRDVIIRHGAEFKRGLPLAALLIAVRMAAVQPGS